MPLPYWPASSPSEDRPVPVLHPAGEVADAGAGTVAEGHLRIDGKRVAKPSDEVRAGAVVALPLHGRVRVIEVVTLPVRRGPASEAQSHYREILENVSQQSPDD